MTEYLQKFQANYTQSKGLSSNDIRAIVVDKTDQVWVGTSHGLCRLTGETWTEMLRIDDISLLYADEAGKIWIGVDERLLDGNGKIVFQMSATIQSITEDQQGQMWIATKRPPTESRWV